MFTGQLIGLTGQCPCAAHQQLLSRGSVRELRFTLLRQHFSNSLVSRQLLLKIENLRRSFIYMGNVYQYLEIGLKSEIETIFKT